jgi:aminobenzoyl-glutamate transport protein
MKGKKNILFRFAKTVERVGNKLPHPVYIFIYLLIAVMIASAICSALGVSVTYDAAGSDGTVSEKTVSVINLLSRSELQNFIGNISNAYNQVKTLNLLIIVVMFMAVAEEVGLFQSALRKLLLKAPRILATYALCVVGICANICSDAGMILSPTLGAVLFKALGRNPWIGIAAGYGAAAAGFTANLLPVTTDVALSGISAQLAEAEGYHVHALSNYIFLVVATIVAGATLAYVTEKFLTPLYGDYKEGEKLKDESGLISYALRPEEEKGLKRSGIGALCFIVFLILGCLPVKNVPLLGFFRDPDTFTLVPKSPLLSGIVPVICIFFLCIGIPYGVTTGAIKKKSDIPSLMIKGVEKMAGLISIFFFCSLFIYQFNRSGLSTIISVSGEMLIRSFGLEGFPLLVVFILVITVINIFMYSGTAKWMILAPVFIPLFSRLGIHPAMTQLAYRIGDSSTNNLTPLNACLLATIVLMQQYRDPELNPEEPGIGTVLSGQFVVSITILVTMILLLAVFYYTGLPIGIGM